MATPYDYTSELYGTGINVGANLVGNYFSGQALQQSQNQMAGAYNAAGQYITNASNQAANVMDPYLQSGYSALPGLQSSIQNMAQPYTMEQFNQSGYGQVADAALKQQQDQLRAQSAQVGMYGSGNMANALAQNAVNTKMGYYDTANKQNLQQNQALTGAVYNQAALGSAAGQNIGNNYLNSAQSMSELAQAQGQNLATTTQNQNALTGNSISALTQLAQTALQKYRNGQQLTPQEQSALMDAQQVTVNPITQGQAASDWAWATDPANGDIQANVQAWNDMYSGQNYGYIPQADPWAFTGSWDMPADTNYIDGYMGNAV